MKTNKMITIPQDLIDKVEERLKKVGGKFSTLTEQLLISWCDRQDTMNQLEELMNKPRPLKDVKTDFSKILKQKMEDKNQKV